MKIKVIWETGGFWQRHCPHWKIFYLGDAFDSEFICAWCGKIWWNEQPAGVNWSLRFSWNGKEYRISRGRCIAA